MNPSKIVAARMFGRLWFVANFADVFDILGFFVCMSVALPVAEPMPQFSQ